MHAGHTIKIQVKKKELIIKAICYLDTMHYTKQQLAPSDLKQFTKIAKIKWH